jgi:hypothetical protein
MWVGICRFLQAIEVLIETTHAKIAPFEEWICSMDVEHINAIGNALADLTQRTIDLRGYL